MHTLLLMQLRDWSFWNITIFFHNRIRKMKTHSVRSRWLVVVPTVFKTADFCASTLHGKFSPLRKILCFRHRCIYEIRGKFGSLLSKKFNSSVKSVITSLLQLGIKPALLECKPNTLITVLWQLASWNLGKN